MTLLEHLEELRKRIVHSLIAVVVTTGAAWAFKERIFNFLARPIYATAPFQDGEKLAILGVTDAFLLYLKSTLLVGLFVAAPVLLYQFYLFISPGLYRKERLWAIPFVTVGSLFFLAGGAFAYFVAFPFAVEFLLDMGAEFDPVITGEKYFGFLMTVILGLGLMFELPVILFLLATLGLVTHRPLLRHFRWAVLIIFIVAALVTPTPDIFNLLIFALPTVGLYLLGIFAVWIVTLGRERRSPGEEWR